MPSNSVMPFAIQGGTKRPVRGIGRQLAGFASLGVAVPMLSGCNGPTETSVAAATVRCDRQCLVDMTDRYLAALIGHDASKVPLSGSIEFVENLERLDPGKGLWETAGAIDTELAVYVPDQVQQQAGWMGVIKAGDKSVVLALRLKLKDGKIAQAEHLYAPLTEGSAERLGRMKAKLTRSIGWNERLDHDELIRIGSSYYSAVDNNDGALAPFAADCQRIENGVITAGNGAHGAPNGNPTSPGVVSDCKGQIDSQAFVYIDRIERRRMVAADPVTGLAMGFSQFRHSMSNLPYKVTLSDGSIARRDKSNMPYEPFDMPAAHIFKIGPEGQIHEIEAVGMVAPFEAPSGWE